MVLLNLPDHIIDLLLTIDHEELRQDLENIIRYGLGKYQHLIATGELFAAIRHSIILLAEVVKSSIGVNCSGRSMLLMYMNGITG